MDPLDMMLPPHWHKREDGSYYNDMTGEESAQNPAMKFLEMRNKYYSDSNKADVKGVLDDYIAEQQLKLEFSQPAEPTSQPTTPSPVKSSSKRFEAIEEELSMGSGDFPSFEEINKLGVTGSSRRPECKGKHCDYKTQWNERDLFGKVTLYGLMIRYYEDHNTLIKFDGIDGEWIFTSLKGPYGRLTQHDLYIGAQVVVFGRHLTILSCNAAAVQWAEKEYKRLDKQQELFRSKIISVGQKPCVLKPEAQTIKHITRDQKAIVHVNLRKMMNENARLGEQLSSLGLVVEILFNKSRLGTRSVMFSSVSKYLDTAAAAEAFSQAKNAIVQSTAIEHIYCRGCQGQITIVTAGGRMVSSNQCRMCGNLFCSNCLAKSKVGIPNHMLILDYRKPVNSEDYHVNEKHLLCKPCTDVAKKACMDIFSIGMHDKFEECMNQYLESGETQIFLFPIPGANPEDTTYRKALRIAVIAEAVADYTGFSMTFKAVKYAYYSSELINIITKGGLAAVLGPLMESLKDYGITGPTAVLRIYYLGCKHTLEFKANVSLKSQLYLKNQTGVLLPECPLNILQYVSGFLSPAQWLYVASLPAPHHTNEWSSWYFSRIIRRQGWTVLMCVNDTTELPNGIKCPAFALVSRKRRSKTTGAELREAILVVRGSKSTMDWAINFDEALVDMEYTYKANCQELNSPGNGNVLTVAGKAHKGIHQGALGILDAFSVRTYLIRLLVKGYKITVVGHSLGAGTAALLAAEMRSTVIRDGVEAKMRAENGGVTPPPGTRLTVSEHNCILAHNISAVIFASPAIVSEPIADAFAIDKLLINVVAGNDIIPRVSRKSFAQLAREINDCTAAANAWTAADKSDLWNYVQNMGKASDVHASYGQKSGEKDTADEPAAIDPSAPPLEEVSSTADPEVPSLSAEPAAAGAATNTTASAAVAATVAVSAAATIAATNALSSLWGKAKAASSSSSSSSVAPAPSAPPAPAAEPASSASAAAAAPPAKPAKPEKPPKATPSSASSTVPSAPPPAVVAVEAVPVKDEKVSEAIAAKLQIDDPDVFIVTPSPIIHMYRENNGHVKSAVVTHTHRAFTRIDLILEEVMQDHLMVSYRGLLTSAKHLQAKEERAAGNVKSDGTETLIKQIFNIAHFDDGEKDDFMLDRDGKCEIDRTTVIRQSITNADFIEGVDNVEVAMALQHSVNEALDKSSAVSGPPVEAVVDDGTVVPPSTLSAYTQHWKPCYLCGLDVTWPYMMHSDASRAMVTHNCSSCGEVVCSACSPSGDSLPGDGINKYSTLSDLRIPLPSQGLFSPQRVCLACYFNSSHSIHL